jgi:hypothetical protein
LTDLVCGFNDYELFGMEELIIWFSVLKKAMQIKKGIRIRFLFELY